MTQRNVHAFTETPTPPGGYPAYVSLNQQDDGSYTLTVRSRGMGGSESARITLTADQLLKLAGDITREFNNDAAIDAAVNRFLCWRLPEDFAPDCGISFKREGDFDHPVHGRNQYKPIGTNLFTADQAKAMFNACLRPQEGGGG